MPSLRSSVVALVTSAGVVLLLAGANAGMLSTSWFDHTAAQPVHVDNQDSGAPHTPAFPPVVASQPPAVADPPVVGAGQLPDDPPVTAPAPEVYPAPQREAHVTPVVRQPAPVVQVVHQPVVVEPAPRQPPVAQPPDSQPPDSQPPAEALPHHSSMSRTVNTEPCDCDGHARRVPTHWDPPEY